MDIEKDNDIDIDIDISPRFSITVIAVISLMVIFYIVYSKFEKYEEIIVDKDEQIQSVILNQQQKIKEIENTLDIFKFESDGRVDSLKKQLEANELVRKVIENERVSKEKLSQQKIETLEVKLSETALSQDLTFVIKKWEPLVAYISCDFELASTNIHYSTSGSGIALKFSDSPVKILTNRHVVTNPSFYNLNQCNTRIQGSDKEFVIFAKDVEVSTSEYDWATISINEPDENIKNITSTFPKLCDQKPSLGDNVVVLGYPGIGSKTSITATDGIISGYDDSYFITSAKVEQGNSGGAAILSKDDCLLGIPTFASLGQIESLARILDIWTIIIK